MQRGIRKASRQSQPGSLENARRDLTVSFPQLEGQPETVNCLDIRSDHRMLVSENAVYGAIYNSFSPLYRRPLSVVMRELLNEGAILGNSRGNLLERRLLREAQADRRPVDAEGCIDAGASNHLRP
jgi:hypothetical protein